MIAADDDSLQQCQEAEAMEKLGKVNLMSVYKAINEVQKELAVSGISKDRTNTQGAGYKFRGIDDVYNAISPIMAKHGLCILPRMISRLITERESQAGKALFYVVVEAEFDFVSAEDGSMHTVKTFGEAMDSGDKATNKAMSAAYKYAAFQTFAIPTEGENDADSSTHTVKPKLLHKPNDGAGDDLDEDAKKYVVECAEDAKEALSKKTETENKRAIAIKNNLDVSEQLYFWTFFDSKQRAYIKKLEDEYRKVAA